MTTKDREQEKRAHESHAMETPVEQFIDDELIHAHRHSGHSLPWSSRGPAEMGPLPLIVGVTGHRDLRTEDMPRLVELADAEFSLLRTLYPSTPLTLLSALADGADRLVARLAIESGMRLAVVLPMPVELYETDFDDESKEEFHTLLAKADYWTELPIVRGLTREDIREHGFNREQQYAQAGAYLAAHSAILIALWDGVELNKVGGTSHVVRFKLEGIPEPFAPPHSELDAPDSGPVYHIVTPRRSNPHPAHAFSVNRLYPAGFASLGEAGKAYHDIYSRMETFNEDAIKYSGELKEHYRASKEYLFPSRAHARLSEHVKPRKRHHRAKDHASTNAHAAPHSNKSKEPDPMPSMMREDLDFYAIADVLSQRFQKRTKTTLQLLLMFVFFAALFYEMYSELFEEPVMLLLYLGMFVLSFICYYWAAKKAYQTKYLDYRALAEGLRVQFFWEIAGVPDSVADYYMRKQRSELDWIRHAIRTCTIENTPHKIGSSDEHAAQLIETEQSLKEHHAAQKERLDLALKFWVEDQAKYFAKSAHRDHDSLHKHERTTTLLFGGALLMAAMQTFLGGMPTHYLLLGIGIFPVIAAILQSFLQKNAIAEHKRQYDRMSVFYHRAVVHLQKLIGEDRLADARNFLAELGREALAENGDWILMHRDRPLEVPKGA
jgi:hypothetical protein